MAKGHTEARDGDIAHEKTTTTADGGCNRHFWVFFPTIMTMQRRFEVRKNAVEPSPYSRQDSHLEHNGALFRVADLPNDRKTPNHCADGIDEAIF